MLNDPRPLRQPSGKQPAMASPRRGRTRSAPRASDVRHDLWRTYAQAPWSVGLIGLFLYVFAIISYKYPIGTASAVAALAGAIMLLPAVRIPKPCYALAAFLGWALISSLASPWISVSVDALAEFGKVILVVFAASVIVSNRRVPVAALGWFTLCFILFPVRGALIGGDTVVGRLVWNYIYSNPNDLAVLTLLGLGATLALALLKWRQPFLRVALYVGVAMELWVIVRTQSRGAALGVVAVALTALIAAPAKARRKFLVRGLAIVAFSFPFIPQATLDRYIGGTFQSEDLAMDREQKIAFSSREERLRINAASWKLASANLVFGVGFGAFPSALATQDAELGQRDTHNTYLNVLCETGIPGLGLFLAFLYLVAQEVQAGLRASKFSRPDYHHSLLLFSASVGGFWVAALFGSYIKLVPPMIVMALLVGYAKFVTREAGGAPALKSHRDRNYPTAPGVRGY